MRRVRDILGNNEQTCLLLRCGQPGKTINDVQVFWMQRMSENRDLLAIRQNQVPHRRRNIAIVNNGVFIGRQLNLLQAKRIGHAVVIRIRHKTLARTIAQIRVLFADLVHQRSKRILHRKIGGVIIMHSYVIAQ